MFVCLFVCSFAIVVSLAFVPRRSSVVVGLCAELCFELCGAGT